MVCNECKKVEVERPDECNVCTACLRKILRQVFKPGYVMFHKSKGGNK